MYGKIVDGKLEIAQNQINTNIGVITRPIEQNLIDNGYKPIQYNDKPKYDYKEESLYEVYEETTDKIIVSYETRILTDEEHNEIINSKIQNEYNKVTTKDLIDYICGKKDSTVVNEVINNVTYLQSKIIKGEEE